MNTQPPHSAIRPSDGRRRSPVVEAVAFSHSTDVSPAWRRLITCTCCVIGWVLVTVLGPLWIPVALIVGLVRRRSFIVLRLLAFLWAYLSIELLGLISSAAIYLVARRNVKRRQDLFFKLQLWWGRSLFGSVRRALSLTVVIEGDEKALPGPVLVFVRHASIIDTVLPLVFVSDKKGLRLRYVFKRELLLDPCIDIAGHAMPNYFIDRTGDPEVELAGVRRLADDLGEEGVLLYPEGTRFTKLKQERALKNLGRHHPELVPLAESFKHCLPPKPGGALTLLEAMEGIDVLMFAHRGLEGLAEVSDLLNGEVVGNEIRIQIDRIAAKDLPEPQERLDWLFNRWKKMDEFVAKS